MKPIDQTISNAARDAASSIKSSATKTAAQVKDQAADLAQRGKDQTADKLDTYGQAVHETADGLEQEDPNLAWLSHQAADRLQKVSDFVRNRSFGELRKDAESLARRHPAAFFSGLFVAGLVAGTLIKASASAEAQESNGGANGSSKDHEDDVEAGGFGAHA
jgi:uncharacterized phage infection (PIP) family protein YhgE